MTLVDGQSASSSLSRDRGLLYGDGLFETVRVDHGQLMLWADHMTRLREGCERLKIPFDCAELLESEAIEVVGVCSGVLRITLTRGVGPRGYRSPSDLNPTRIVSFESSKTSMIDYSEEGISLTLCRTCLGRNPQLAGIKHLNRLEQVLARNEWLDEYQEGLMLDSEDWLVEGTMSNVFLVSNSQIFTPELSSCGVEGVMRRAVLRAAKALGLDAEIKSLSLQDARSADALFMTNSVIGIWPVRFFMNREYLRHPMIDQLKIYLKGKC